MRPSLLVVGLGNPTKAYVQTRHNAGFMGVDLLAEALGADDWKHSGKYDAEIAEAHLTAIPVLLCKPQSYMNCSGEPIQRLLQFYKMDPTSELLVLCDDIDIPLGTLRLRMSGSAGTHNGLKSIIERIGEGFARLRIGIGPKPEGADLATWVLDRFSSDELKTLHGAMATIPQKLQEFVMERPVKE